MSTIAIQAVKGMNDILPAQTPYWDFLESVLQESAERYGYREIRFPIVERTQLFERTIGQATDIVEKEMYTFDDHGDSLTLRPEGTAGCVRAAIEHSLLHHQTPRLWYRGPMFRHENPQKGRYRQFQQFAIEAFGMSGPDIDAEQIFLAARVWKMLGLQNDIQLQLNSLGSAASRATHREKLIAYFTQHENELDADSRRRLVTNPLRILDSKNPQMKKLLENAPRLLDFLDEPAQQHFAELRRLLDKEKISYVINPHLVRGLDYYGLTVYEWTTTKLGAQNAVCAGGRYDSLVEQLGWQATPAVGFAIGLERVIALLETVYQPRETIDAYMVLVGAEVTAQGILIAEQIRNALPQLRLLVHCAGGSFKSQFRAADKSSATYALIIGEEELKQQTIAIKNLRREEQQQTLSINQAIEFLRGQYAAQSVPSL